jgi:hypothetical protein
VISGSFPERLAEPAQRLLNAADTYWHVYNNRGAMVGPAVVWVEADDGQLVVMTRGEYGQQLKGFVAELPNSEWLGGND